MAQTITPRAGIDIISIDAVPPVNGGGAAGVIEIGLDTVPVNRGGTGGINATQAAANVLNLPGSAVGDLYVRSATGVARLAAGTSGHVVTSNGPGTAPTYQPGGGGGGITDLTGDVTASGTGSVAATVARIQGRPVASTAPTNGYALVWNQAGSTWEPGEVAATGGGISSLTGDVTASGTGAVAATVARIQGRAVANTAPVNGYALVWNQAASAWQPTEILDTVEVTNASGNNQVTAQLLAAHFNVIGVVDPGQGVRLPVGIPGDHCFVRNSGANPLLIYPEPGGIINQLAVDAAITVGPDNTAFFKSTSATQWYTVP